MNNIEDKINFLLAQNFAMIKMVESLLIKAGENPTEVKEKTKQLISLEKSKL